MRVNLFYQVLGMQLALYAGSNGCIVLKSLRFRFTLYFTKVEEKLEVEVFSSLTHWDSLKFSITVQSLHHCSKT